MAEPASNISKPLLLHWPASPADLSLPAHEVHVWAVQLDLPEGAIQTLGQLLSLSEQNRAARFRFERDRNRFVVARGTLRQLLAQVLGSVPAELEFASNAQGKPMLAGAFAGSGVEFNVSHSDALALIGIARGCAVGVDVEKIRAMLDMPAVAERSFSPTEFSIWGKLPPTDQPLAFFRGWTRKEAYLKALGCGLSKPLDEFDVTLAPGTPARLLADRANRELTGQWDLFELQPAEGFIGALAMQSKEIKIMPWAWGPAFYE